MSVISLNLPRKMCLSLDLFVMVEGSSRDGSLLIQEPSFDFIAAWPFAPTRAAPWLYPAAPAGPQATSISLAYVLYDVDLGPNIEV